MILVRCWNLLRQWLIIVKSLHQDFRGMTEVLCIFCADDVQASSEFPGLHFLVWEFSLLKIGLKSRSFSFKLLKIMWSSWPFLYLWLLSKSHGRRERKEGWKYLIRVVLSKLKVKRRNLFYFRVICSRYNNGLMVITMPRRYNSEYQKECTNMNTWNRRTRKTPS